MSQKREVRMPTDREAVILQMLVSGERYGLEIRQAYEAESGESMPLGSLYTTMDRMEERGFVKSRMGDATHERGGNRRKYFKITGEGAIALDQYRTRLERSRSIFGVFSRYSPVGMLGRRP